MKIKLLIVILLIAVIPIAGARRMGSEIDWSAYTVRVSYIHSAEVDETGTPIDHFTGQTNTLNRARMEASAVARENAKEIIASNVMKLRVDPETEMSSLIENDERARRKISRILSSKIKFIETPFGHLGSSCQAEIRINDIIEALPFEYPEDEIPRPANNIITTEYSSLIIDARGLDVEPMIFPSIYNESGLEIYGKNFVKIKTVSRRGAASYAANEESALRHRKAGAKPFFTVAVKNINGCPVISLKDYRKITSGDATVANIKSGMVIIIIDKKKISQ